MWCLFIVSSCDFCAIAEPTFIKISTNICIFCKSCEIIFSELCDINFEGNYKDVLDPLYIEQIENKKEYFNHLINKISDHRAFVGTRSLVV